MIDEMNDPVDDGDEIAPTEEEVLAAWRRRSEAYGAQLRRQAADFDRFLTQLFCAEDSLDRRAPQPIKDMESLLGEHAAQLRNAARYLMGYVTRGGENAQDSIRAATAISAVVRTNVAVANALRDEAEQNRKTVHGVAVTVEPQD